jgi:hypothetical protein
MRQLLVQVKNQDYQTNYYLGKDSASLCRCSLAVF